MDPALTDLLKASKLLKNLNETQLEMVFEEEEALERLTTDFTLEDYNPGRLPSLDLVKLGDLLEWDFGIHQRDVCLRIFSTEEKLEDMPEVRQSLFVFAACLPSTLEDTGDQEDVQTYLQNLLSTDRYPGMEELTARCKTKLSTSTDNDCLIEYDYKLVGKAERAKIKSWIPSLRLLVPILMASFANNRRINKAALIYLNKIKDFILHAPGFQQLAQTYPSSFSKSQRGYEFGVNLDFILGPRWESRTIDKPKLVQQTAKLQPETQVVDEKKQPRRHSSTRKRKTPSSNDDLEITQGSPKQVKVSKGERKPYKFGQKYSFLSPIWEALLESASSMEKIAIRAVVESGSKITGMPEDQQIPLSNLARYFLQKEVDVGGLVGPAALKKLLCLAGHEHNLALVGECFNYSNTRHDLVGHFTEAEVREALLPDLKPGSAIDVSKSKILQAALDETFVAYQTGGICKTSIPALHLLSFFKLVPPQYDDKDVAIKVTIVNECDLEESHRTPLSKHALDENGLAKVAPPILALRSTQDGWLDILPPISDQSRGQHLTRQTTVWPTSQSSPSLVERVAERMTFFNNLFGHRTDRTVSDIKALTSSSSTDRKGENEQSNAASSSSTSGIAITEFSDSFFDTFLHQSRQQDPSDMHPSAFQNSDEKDRRVLTATENVPSLEASLEQKEDIKHPTNSSSRAEELESTPAISSTEVLERKSPQERRLERQRRIQKLRERNQESFYASEHDWNDFKKWDKVYKDLLHTSLDAYNKNIDKEAFRSGNFKVVFLKADLKERKVQDEGGLTTEWITSFWRLLMQPALGLSVASLDDSQSIGLNVDVSACYAQLLGWLFGVALRKNISLDPLPRDFLKLFVECGTEDRELENVFEGDTMSQYLAKYSPFYRLMFHSHRAWYEVKEESAAESRAIVDQMKENYPVDIVRPQTTSLVPLEFTFKKPASEVCYQQVKFDAKFAQSQELDSDFAAQIKPSEYGTQEMATFAFFMAGRMKTSLRQIKKFFVDGLSMNIACKVEIPSFARPAKDGKLVIVPRRPFWTVLLQALPAKTNILSADFFVRNMHVKTPGFRVVDEHGNLFANPKDAWLRIVEILALLDGDRRSGIAQIKRIHEAFGVEMEKSDFLDEKNPPKPFQFTPYEAVHDGAINMDKLAVNKDAFVFTTKPEVLYHFKPPNALKNGNMHTISTISPLSNSSSDTSSAPSAEPKVEKKEREVKHKLGEQEKVLRISPENSYLHGLLHAFTSSRNVPLSGPTLTVEAMEKEEIKRSGLISFHTCFNTCNVNCNHLWTLSELFEHVIGHIISSEYTAA